MQNCALPCSLAAGWKSSDKVEEGVGEPLLGSKEEEKEEGEKVGGCREELGGGRNRSGKLQESRHGLESSWKVFY